MSKKENDDEEESEVVEWIGLDKIASMISGVSYAYSKRDKTPPFFLMTFYFSPPEAKEHTHNIVSRIMMEWDTGEEFAKDLLKFIQENKPK